MLYKDFVLTAHVNIAWLSFRFAVPLYFLIVLVATLEELAMYYVIKCTRKSQ